MFLVKFINHITKIPLLKKFSYLFIFLVLFSFSKADAQQQLATQIQIPAYSNMTVGQIFQVLNEKHGTLFSFNSNILQTDSVIQVSAYKGSLYGFLDHTLGKEYSFKEIGKHIIIQYTPQRMAVDVEVQSQDKNKVVITGYIKNIRTNKPISDASIFDRDALLSTLTDKNGYFELDVKKKISLIAVNVSKAMFRDTSVLVIFPIDTEVGNKKRSMVTLPDMSKTMVFIDLFWTSIFITGAKYSKYEPWRTFPI
ncbi:hypothetical protein [Sphingobacterium sp. IITKGP-BTPF85]|uniref:hypothetical protein n=1 Tax=Sphingobacterium sp. IITKGP-BTPF85 TaxID=1338009 RepID=UPI000389F3AB|nr:hypothetical protein [Sphingobacterium sp. IITKGP-BTPF85]KKX52028.1 hypothetical protein L950_0201625 [Sphingobacterium sp. IITKGP-BTPF85]